MTATSDDRNAADKRRAHAARGLAACVLVLGVVGAGVWIAATSGPSPDDKGPVVDGLFAEWNEPGSPGCAVAVIQDGRITYSRGYGTADLDHDIPVSPETVFNIASTSKQFTAAALVLLAQRGQLTLDDDIRKYVPELPEYERPITLRHLLQHTSGIRDFIDLVSLAGGTIDNVFADAHLIDLLKRQKGLNFLPGDDYLYSNSGYILLGIVVERVTGQPFGRFVEQHIFAPLGMTSTRVYDDRFAVVKRRAVGYFEKPDGQLGQRMSAWDRPADGGVLTTVGDLAKWDQNFYDPKVGGPALVAELVQSGRLRDGTSIDYGLGLRVETYRGLQMVSHSGGIRGFSAQFLRFPEKRLSVVCLCNSSNINATAQARRIVDTYLFDEPADAAPPPTTAGAVDTKDLAPLVGTYRQALTRQIARVEIDDKALVLRRGSQPVRLHATTPTQFRAGQARGPVLTFAADGFELSDGGIRPSVFERVTLASPTVTQLAGYAGTYCSDELESALTITVRDDHLWLDRRFDRPVALTPAIEDEFSGDGFVLAFAREGERVARLELATSRVRGIRFDRLATPQGTCP